MTDHPLDRWETDDGEALQREVTFEGVFHDDEYCRSDDVGKLEATRDKLRERLAEAFKNLNWHQGQTRGLEQERDQLQEDKVELLALLRETRMYALGSDCSTNNLLARVDSVLTKHQAPGAEEMTKQIKRYHLDWASQKMVTHPGGDWVRASGLAVLPSVVADMDAEIHSLKLAKDKLQADKEKLEFERDRLNIRLASENRVIIALEQERDKLQEDKVELLAFIASVEHESECSADGGCVCGLLDLLDKHKELKT